MGTRNEPDETRAWPRPQDIKRTGKTCALAQPLRLVTKGNADWLAAEAARAAKLIRRAAGKTVASPGSDGPGTFTITDMDRLPARTDLKAVTRPEGYVLKVTPTGIVLAGADAAGVYYGARTVARLLEKGAVPTVPCVAVRDWPAFPMRGAHVYLPPRAHFDFFFKFLDLLAEYKCNTLVLEIGGGMELDRHPEINETWRKFSKESLAYDWDTDTKCLASKRGVPAERFPTRGPVALQLSRYFPKDSIHPELAGGDCLSKKEIRKLIRACADHHIEIIPEVQSLSHSYYLCMAHPEIAERTDDPWPDTYCPSNPKSYELLFDVMDEVIDLFKPRVMHIGHDEAYTFRVCRKCRKRVAHDIFADDVTKVHDFLAERGIRTLLWGDKFMNITTPDGKRYGGIRRSETYPGTKKRWDQPATFKAADKVPADLMINDWYWSFDPKSERNFHKHGFDVFYGNFSPLRFQDWEARAHRPYVLGAEMSSWCEVSAYAFAHNGTLHQFFPGADMLWNGRQMAREEVGPLMAVEMTRKLEALTGQKRWLVSGGRGRVAPVDLAAALRPVPKALAGRLATGPSATPVTGGGSFSPVVDAKGNIREAIVLDAANPKAAAVAVGRKIKRLLLLQGTTMTDVFFKPTYYSFHRGPAVLLRWRVTYNDGRRAEFQSLFGEDVGPLAGVWPTSPGGACFRAVPVPAGDAHTLFAQEWENPRPKAAIKQIDVSLGEDATQTGEVIVAAVCGVL